RGPAERPPVLGSGGARGPGEGTGGPASPLGRGPRDARLGSRPARLAPLRALRRAGAVRHGGRRLDGPGDRRRARGVLGLGRLREARPEAGGLRHAPRAASLVLPPGAAGGAPALERPGAGRAAARLAPPRRPGRSLPPGLGGIHRAVLLALDRKAGPLRPAGLPRVRAARGAAGESDG